MRNRELLDGKYVPFTTRDLSTKEILETYRNRDTVERAFRTSKQSIKICPIWNRKEQHIKAHLFVCFLVYLLMKNLVPCTRQRPRGTEPRPSGHSATSMS